MQTQRTRTTSTDELDEHLGTAIAYRPSLAWLCGSVVAGVMLSQAIYWRRRTKDPEGWFYKTAAEWQRETGLSQSNQESARYALRKFEFWSEARKGITGTLHYRVDIEGVKELLKQQHEKPRMGFGEMPKQVSANYQNKIRRTTESAFADLPKPYKEAEITEESTAKRIPPTPLSQGGEAKYEQEKWKAERLGELKTLLKDEMLNASFQSKNLHPDDYDYYFRDTWFADYRDGVVLVDGSSRSVTAEGLSKYASRLKRIGRKVFGVEVQFQMTEASGELCE